MRGKIIKGVGGFYYINLPDGRIFECKAKGAFRNQGIKPYVGDNVEIDSLDEDALTGNIVSLYKRTNKLIRPAVSNVDQAVIIFALADPAPNYNLLDRFLITMERQSVKTIICLNKADLVKPEEADRIKQIYEHCGYTVVLTTVLAKCEGIDQLKNLINNKTTVFAGPSGVGKSSLLNMLNPNQNVKVGAISEKIKRGKHTTRHSELIWVSADTYIMDTPGFSSLFVEELMPEDVKAFYSEFEEYADGCRFNGCVHINEPDCMVKEALDKKLISKLRYDNYKQLYEEQKNKRRW